AFDTAVILVTHDMGIVAGNCDEMVVLYGGQVMESGPIERIFAVPHHPYTRVLLDAVPRLDRDDERMPAIPGDPLDMNRLPAGCPYAARCPRVTDRCHRERPAMERRAPGRLIACHRPLDDAA
ncbi:MAG: oligopeptide ABC transporter ATP-binding protein OppD, partial [Chloroflexi bacterium]|nr:oligopeptide ABC transporter ATP-binding protein OppD [Chloroflexota bacterium]